MSNAGHTNRTCPSLGLMDDAQTSLAFPSIWNNCYRSRPVAPPKLKYQEEVCLCENHRECPLFLSEQTVPLPGHIRSPRSHSKSSKGTLGRIIFLLLILGVVFALVWGLFGKELGLPFTATWSPETASQLLAPTKHYTISPTTKPSLAPTLALASTALPVTPTTISPSVTPLVSSSKHQLEIPIGTDRKFIIHRVLEGENLDQYERIYNTSLDAIMTINFKLTPPVWVGTLVIVPVGFVDVTDVPSFEPYMVTEAGMTSDLIAQKFEVNLLDLKYYNAISDGEQLVVGEWLLIPHERATP